MSKKEPMFVEVMNWKGTDYVSELIDEVDFSDFEPVTQVQAVCFYNDKVVLYKDVDGNFGLPGGSIEDGESYKEALWRELEEEASIKPTHYEPLLLIRSYEKNNPDDISYQLRYWAEVELLDKPVNDPDGKAVERILCDPDEALEKLGWGEKAEVYFDVAKEKRKAAGGGDL